MQSVQSIDEYLKVVSAYPREGRIFRGLAKSSYQLVPKVGRPEFELTYSVHSERHLLRLFKQRAYAFVEKLPGNDLEWLALAQHHGLPTRLLDWTVNPMIALFFAVQGSDEEDGAVCTCHFPRGSVKDFDPFNLEKPRKYYPPHVSPRITAQEALFTIQDPAHTLDSQYSRSAIEKILISRKLKFDLLHGLDQIGFNHEKMFPGLEGSASLLEWRFSNNIGKWKGPKGRR